MSITSKIDKVNIHFDLVYASTTSLSAFKRTLSQRDAALVERRQWELKKIIDKKYIEQEWEYKVVWADSWIHKNELENAQKLLQQFDEKDSASQMFNLDKSVWQNRNCHWNNFK
jgi:hypothetical protein